VRTGVLSRSMRHRIFTCSRRALAAARCKKTCKGWAGQLNGKILNVAYPLACGRAVVSVMVFPNPTERTI
jgi:hypothetical protein